MCELTTWLYRVEGLTVEGRCLQCWMDTADAGIISGGLYECIRKSPSGEISLKFIEKP